MSVKHWLAASRTALFLLTIALQCFGQKSTSESKTVPAAIPDLPKLLVVNPVNLATFAVLPVLSDQLKGIFNQSGKWNVIPFDVIKNKYQEYSIDINKPCKEFTCAYDAGSIIQADYTLYSTVTRIQDVYIYNLNLIDITATKVVWTKVGEVPIKSSGNSSEALIHRFSQLTKNLEPAKIKISSVQTKGLLGILDLSTPTEYSHILFERLSTHAYTSGQYDLIGQTELNFLVEALNIKITELTPNKSNMIPLGEKLGLDFLIYSKLSKRKETFILNLALFDIQKKKLIREWPYETKTYRKLLKFEDTFFSTLQKVEDDKGGLEVVTSSGSGVKWKWVFSGTFMLSSGVTAWLAYVNHKKIDNELLIRNQAENLKDFIDHDTKAKNAQKDRNLLAILTGGLFTISLVMLTF